MSLTLTNKPHGITTIEAMQKILSNSAEKGAEIKIITIDGKVHVAKDILLLFSPVLRRMFAESLSSVIEHKELIIIMKDVRTSCLRHLRSLITNGKIMKLLNSSEIEEICVAGTMLGINLENLSNVSGGASQDKLRIPSTFFVNIKKEPVEDLPPPVPLLDTNNKDSSVTVSEVIEQSQYEHGEYICSPPSSPLQSSVSPLRVKFRKVHNSNSVKDVAATIPETETLSVAESISTPRSDVQESYSQPMAHIDDQMQISVDSEDSENESDNNNQVEIDKTMYECELCTYKTSDSKLMKKHKKDIHKQRSDRAHASDKSKKKEAKYFCNKCDYKTHSRGMARQHPSLKPGHICSKICLRCGRRHTEQHPCSFSADVKCLECLRTGHVQFLHRPTCLKDYEELKKLTNGMGIEIRYPSSLVRAGARNLKCQKCPFETIVLNDMYRHSRDVHDELFVFLCEICPFKTHNRHEFRRHKCGDVTYNHRAPAPNVSGLQSDLGGNAPPSSASGTPDEPTSLCLICGGHHGPRCHFSIDAQCAFRGCGQNGHVETLHFPKNYNDYKIIKSWMPDLLLSAIPQSQ